MPDELYDDEGRTPSQAQMDSQTQAQAALAAQQTIGALKMAGQQIVQAVNEGADRETAREILGRMDAIAQGESFEGEDTEVYANYQRFMRTHQRGPERAASSAAAASAARTPVVNKANKNKARQDYHEGKTNVYPG
ncbi:MAG: hypothetical protein IH822_03100 [Chloroflexi bacterium]|nr:hypothetical protein [Chloroflexota bacterium]